jgi:endonuclease YncB( thermonuclease family)
MPTSLTEATNDIRLQYDHTIAMENRTQKQPVLDKQLSTTHLVRTFKIISLLSVALTQFASAETITGHVVAISDGDTITVLDSNKTQHKVRLAGIDAPEKAQPFGQASKKHLSDLVFNKDVTLDCSKTDKYRREVCVVMVNGKDANQAQVASGMAWW